jgi:predicted NACHT family NTPase
VTRFVRQLSTLSDRDQDTGLREFANFSDRPNIILLGDPGAGKSYLFRESATAENGRYIIARHFLSIPSDRLHAEVLFIDGLDERRSGRGDRDTVDALTTKLFEVAPSKVRISCRVADWLGQSDLAALKPFLDETGGVCVLHLEDLSREEQLSVLAGEEVTRHDAEAFLDVASQRGLEEFLQNPQNLLMLYRAVRSGAWPQTRKELFELSTALMLQEHNEDRGRSGTGIFSATELRPVAGAICAARLISDVSAISLTNQEGPSNLPSYRSLSLFPAEQVLAVLGRRAFDRADGPEAVDYAHRTTAEFLAAEYLAARARDGLPIGRIMALIGIDGKPASELRGLHAWLAVHLREHSEELVDADPYGLLTYGDAASLSKSSCAQLLRSLVKLSEANPWFRSGHWRARPIGALSRPDMVDEFRAILHDPISSFGIRSLVVEALALGTPIPEMLHDLEVILARQRSSYDERLHSLDALARLGDAGRSAIRSTFDDQLGSSVDDLRLRIEIVQLLYGNPYGPAEVIALLETFNNADEIPGVGTLWFLADSIPESDLPVILDGIPAVEAVDGYDQVANELGLFFTRILVRAWSTPAAFGLGRAMEWLLKRVDLSGNSAIHLDDLRLALRSKPDRLYLLADEFFNRVPIDEKRWLSFARFREAILFELGPEVLAATCIRVFDAAIPGSERRQFLYEVGISLSFQLALSDSTGVFDDLYEQAEHDETLRDARDTWIITKLWPDYLERRSGRTTEVEEDQVRQQLEFDQKVEQIRSGGHLGWLEHLVQIYFGLYSDVDRSLSPRARIAAWLGEVRVDAALEGLAASLTRSNLPNVDEIVSAVSGVRHPIWWYTIIAGLNERWASGQGLSDLDDDLLRGALVVDIANPFEKRDGNRVSWVIHPWRTALTEQRPKFVLDSYLSIVRARLHIKNPFVCGLPEILKDPAFESDRQAAVLELLQKFPNSDLSSLSQLLYTVAKLPAIYQDFLQLAEPIVSGAQTIDGQQRDLWLVTAYVISPTQFAGDIQSRAMENPDIIFTLRDRVGFNMGGQPDHELPLLMLEFMAQLTGSLFLNAPHPIGGTWGTTNSWDASEFFRALINTVSASPSPAATGALERLLADQRLDSYRPYLLYALDNQQRRRRDIEYDRPDWLRTVAAIANLIPATVADLHALLVAHLHDLANEIARANTDIFKQFWNLDHHGRLGVPRPENYNRDTLITLLRPRLLPLNITVEPEGQMVADRRADISAAMPDYKVLCELKHDYHQKVWTAMTGQLERFYTHDPEARGFGIYVVFWFGIKRPRVIPKPPHSLPAPQGAAEMEASLRSILPTNMRNRLVVVVLDVSGEV